jgi:hypothetical protein
MSNSQVDENKRYVPFTLDIIVENVELAAAWQKREVII